MLPYVIAGAVAVVLLALAYRAFGGSAVAPVDPAVLLRSVHDALVQLTLDTERMLQPHPGPPVAASPLRRRAEGCAQQLQQVDVASLADSAATVHALLSTAADDLIWCLRLAQSPAHESSSGVQAAARTLCTHAGACIEEAALQPASSARAEEAEGAG